MATLFDPLKLGDLRLPNRIIMAPLTRSRAGASRIPNHLMAEYYAQRASAGLILSEATVVSPMGIGYADTPGIWSQEQVEGWRLATQAVHRAEGRIFLQLWHVGRISDPRFLNGVGVHLAPRGDAHSMGDSDLPRTFEYVARRLGERKIAFICAREYVGPDRLGPKLKAAFGGVYIANEKFTYETAERAVESGEADAVAFGKLFIANPDLPARFALHAPLNEPQVPEFYAGGAKGYTDYPTLPPGAQSPDLNCSQARVNARVSSGV